jgi:putative tryptophan/tyrosine transport system substrate-binding protein
MGRIEMPQRDSLLPYRGVLSFLSKAREASVKRRAFISLLGGAALAWPLAARAQPPGRTRRIGVLMSTPANDKEGRARITAFVEGLRELGWIDGHNVAIDTR